MCLNEIGKGIEDNRHSFLHICFLIVLYSVFMQTENFEETCAICLETPTIGETIRHLPCLHKFHKDVGISFFAI